jgi:hypothetical protein
MRLSMTSRSLFAAALAAALMGQAAAQTAPAPAAPGPAAPGPAVPGGTTPAPSFGAPATPPAFTSPLTPPVRSGSPLLQRDGGILYLSASLAGVGPIRSGITWRLYSDPQDGGPPALMETTDAASPSFPLLPGAYIVHATFGLASSMKRVVMGGAPTTESLVINAGGLVLNGFIGDQPIPPEKLRFNVYVPQGTDPEGRLVAENARPNVLIRLPEGSYRVVSTYGDSNAIASADLKVESGQVLEAVMRHRAATVTLKLVVAPGTEALANTAFSVLTPGGDTIREAIGAFPSMTLAEGDYIAIARNGGKVYTQEFSVKTGLDRDIEVLVK